MIVWIAALVSVAAFTAVAQNPNQAASTTSVPAPTLVPIEGFPKGQFLNDLQTWLNTIWQTVLEVTTPVTPVPATINIAPDTVVYRTDWSSGYGTINAPTQEMPASSGPFALGDGLSFTHELMLQILSSSHLGSHDAGILEGIANGEVTLIYRKLFTEHPELFPAGYFPTGTQAWITPGPGYDMWNSRRIVVFGGAAALDDGVVVSDFYHNAGNQQFDSIASLLAHVVNKLGGDYRQLTAAMNVSPPMTRAEFLAMLDGICPSIDGVKCSTVMREDVTSFPESPEGIYFGLQPIGGNSKAYPWVVSDDWPFDVSGFTPVVVGYSDPTASLENSGTSYPTIANSYSAPNPIPVAWSLSDATGKQITAQSVDGRFSNSNAMTFATSTEWFYSFLDEGAYLTSACLTSAVGSFSCAPDPKQNDTDVSVFLGGDQLSPCDMAVVANGPVWGELTNNVDLTATSPLGITAKRYPGLFIFSNLRNADGSCEDLTVTDGTYIRTFSPDRYAPTRVNFVHRSEPIFLPGSLTRATDFKVPDIIVPGGLYSLFGWSFTGNEPCAASKFPISAEGSCGTATNDQGRTEVVWTLADGKTQLKSAILYVDFGQINFQAPLELGSHIGEKVTVTAVRNGTSSFESMTFTIGASDPSLFVIDYTAKTAAALFADPRSPKYNQLVTAENPAFPGDILSVFGTGIGLEAMSQETGMPCSGANAATTPVTVTIGGVAATVLYAGCAPGFAGLDQYNVVVPDGISGTVPLTVTVTTAGTTQQQVVLPVR